MAMIVRAQVPVATLMTALVLTASWAWSPQPVHAAEQQIKPAAYTFNRETIKHSRETDENPIYADPTLTKLTDGQKDNKALKVIWRAKGWDGGRFVDIRFTFGQPFELRRVLVHSFRRRAYAVQRIQVFAQSADGERVVGDVTLNQEWKYPPKPDLPKTKVMELPVPCEPAIATGARVRVYLISYLGLSEVEFFGVPQEAPAVPKTAGYQLPPAVAGKPFRIVAGDFDGDGHQDFLMENAEVAYVIEPRWGGVANYAMNKRTGVNMVKPNAKGTWGGLFADRMYPTGQGEFFSQKYVGEIVTNSPEKVAVRVRGNGKSGRFVHITFEKTYSLEPHNVALRADYRVFNGQDNVVDVDYGAWVLSGMGSTKEATSVFWADENGPRELKDLNTQYVYEPRRGWLGMRTESGSGIVMLSEYRRTASFLLWRSGDFATIEFKMGRYPIKAGGSIGMTAWAVPFHGIGRPHGASAAMVGSIDVPAKLEAPPESVAFRLKASRPGTFTVIVESRRLPSKDWQQHSKTEAALDTTPKQTTADLGIDGPGTYLLRVRAVEAGKEVFQMERPVTVVKASGAYAMAPECERYLPESAEDKKGRIDYHSLDYQTEHVPWAKQWAGGKPRVLFLPRRRAGIREAVELRQRFEMDLHTSYLPRSMTAGCLYELSDFVGRLTAPRLLGALKKTLKEEAFDALVIPGDLWKDLKPPMQRLILDKVKGGTGLVLLAPEHVPDELHGLVRLAEPEAKVRRFRGAWRPAADHFITDGVPFNVLPETQALPYDMGGEVLATVGDRPLVAVGELGSGRVVVASWVVAGLSRKEYHQTYGGVGLLPNMLSLGARFSCEFHYWEYQMSLLMRMVYWAARRESSVRGSMSIDEAKADGSGQASLRLRDGSGKTDGITVVWTLRDRFSRTVDTGSIDGVALRDQDREIPLAFRAALDGPVYLEAIASRGGKTCWWGTATGQVSAPARIEDATIAKSVWRREEVLSGEIRLAGDVLGSVLIEGVDAYGRVFARQQMEAKSNVAYQLPLKDCLGLAGEVVVRLILRGKTVSEERVPFAVYHLPDATRMQVAFGWPCVTPVGQRRFLHRHYYRRLAHLGATAIRTHFVTSFEWFEARSLGLPTLKSRAGAGVGGKHPDKRDHDQGKLGLLRDPCLSDPEVQQRLVTDNARATAFEDAGVLYRGLGDELNSIGHWDGCFSPHCQRQFRVWLRERYQSLDALNREWATSYGSWDGVMALALEEVKGRASLAPWVDHRLFNYWNWPRSLAAVLEGLQRSNPDIRLGFSGTQETKPWNAYDWWQICKSVSAVAAYSGEQVVQRRSFSKDMYSMSWIGYTANFEQSWTRILSCLFDGDRGFNVFSGRFMVDPDYTIPDRGDWLRKALGIVAGGRAEVIMGSRHDAGPIALHYSPASVCVDEALGINAVRTSETTGIRRLLLEQSADYDYIAYAQLEEGEAKSLDGRSYRLLVLPTSTAMSDKECDTIRRWVAVGGVLVGGLGTATHTQHGRPRGAGALDDVFGLSRTRSQVRSGSASVAASGSAHGVELDGFEIPVENVEVGLSPAGASVVAWTTSPAAKRPAVFVNRHGTGVAIYLAADLASTYGVWGATRRMASRVEPARGMDRFVASLLKLAEIEGRPIPLAEDGQRLPCTRVVLRSNGSMPLIGVIRDSQEAQSMDPKPHRVTLRLDRPWHVYELVTRRYAGHTDVYQDTFTPNTHRALVLLPYKVNGLRTDCDPAVRRGDRVSLKASILADSTDFAQHRVSVTVLDPDKKQHEAYDGLLLLPDGVGTLSLPIALNAATGEWRVTLRDAISNATAMARFVVVE